VPSQHIPTSVSAATGRRATGWQRSRLAAHSPAAPGDPGVAGPALLDDVRLAAVRTRLEELRGSGRVQRITCQPQLVGDGLHLAATNLRRGVRHLDDPDVAIVFLYQSVVNTADTVLHCLGYHARDFEGHKLAIAVSAEVVAALLGRSRARLMTATCERLRRRRHEALYSRSGVLTESDARALVGDCREFLPRVWALVGRRAGMPAAVA
jgi:hypothetical protein